MSIYHNLIEHHNIPALKFNPIHYGLIKYDLYLQLYECGWHLERLSGFASVLGHLYTAVCNVSVLFNHLASTKTIVILWLLGSALDLMRPYNSGKRDRLRRSRLRESQDCHRYEVDVS